MTTSYQTKNICGGGATHRRLDAAIRDALAHDGDGYVYSARGRRPVIEDGDGVTVVGEYGETYDALRDRVCDC